MSRKKTYLVNKTKARDSGILQPLKWLSSPNLTV